jgi:hypothetical protein
MRAEFVPVCWWQAVDFIRINLEMIRDRDPWADRILSCPWSLYSLLEYIYMLVNLISSCAYFIVADGERVGVFWLLARSRVLYIHSLGLLPHFRTSVKDMTIARLLMQSVRTIEELFARLGCEVTVARIATRNEAIQRMASIFRSQSLGIATTTLLLSPANLSETSSKLEVRRIKKPEAAKAWKKWKVHTAERVSGNNGVKAAVRLLEAFSWLDPLPKGAYFSLYKDGQEAGFAFIRRRESEWELGLFPSGTLWPAPQTAELVAALALHINTPIRYLTLTQKHADTLEPSTAHLKFERNRDQERYFVFWLPEVYYGTSP